MMLKAINKNGVEIEYSLELAQDLLHVHKLVASDIIENIYGTKFNITKEVVRTTPDVILEFTLTTNDEKDLPFKWKQKE